MFAIDGWNIHWDAGRARQTYPPRPPPPGTSGGVVGACVAGLARGHKSPPPRVRRQWPAHCLSISSNPNEGDVKPN